MKKQIYISCVLGMIVFPLTIFANAEAPGAPPSAPVNQQPASQVQPPAQEQQPSVPASQPPPQPVAPPPQQVAPQQPPQQMQQQPQPTANNQQPRVEPENDMTACLPDIKEFCSKAKTEKKKVACLQENRSKVLTACLKVVDNKLRIEKEEAEKRRNRRR